MPACSRAVAFLLALFLHTQFTPAQPTTAPSAEDVEAAARLRVYLVTMGPGSAVWEQFGHNAIQIVDPDRDDFDIACNWGVFDFDEGFYGRFILGRLLYSMEVANAPRMIDFYRQDNRSVYRQELNLTGRQKAILYRYVAWNAKPENRDYRYDYYTDNCSTRARDVIDRALNGDLKSQLAPMPTGTTYRWHTRRIMAPNLPLYTSLLFILGQPIDRPISAWEESFLPLRLMDHVRTVRVPDDAGNLVPLVKSEQTIFEAARPPQRTAPPNWLIPFLLLGLACAAGFYALTRKSARSRAARITLVLLATLWAGFIGGAGTFALWGWMYTDHSAVYRNENLFHFFPPAILLAVLIPLAFRKRRLLTFTRYLAVAVPAAAAIGLLIKAHPAFRQVNHELIAWVLPAHLAFAYAVWRVLRPATPARPNLEGEAPSEPSVQ